MLLQIRPSPRVKGKPVVDKDTFKTDFNDFFDRLRGQPGQEAELLADGLREQLPQYYRDLQEELLNKHDEGLKRRQKLWPPNQAAIDAMRGRSTTSARIRSATSSLSIRRARHRPFRRIREAADPKSCRWGRRRARTGTTRTSTARRR